MLHTTIKNNIIRLLKERGWKVADLERKIGRGRSLKNITNGASKNPGIEVLNSIALAFNVEIQELLVEQTDITAVNISLLSDTCTKVIQEVEPLSQSVMLTHDNVIHLVREVYEYSLKLKLEYADENFIKWLIQKYYH